MSKRRRTSDVAAADGKDEGAGAGLEGPSKRARVAKHSPEVVVFRNPLARRTPDDAAAEKRASKSDAVVFEDARTLVRKSAKEVQALGVSAMSKKDQKTLTMAKLVRLGAVVKAPNIPPKIYRGMKIKQAHREESQRAMDKEMGVKTANKKVSYDERKEQARQQSRLGGHWVDPSSGIRDPVGQFRGGSLQLSSKDMEKLFGKKGNAAGSSSGGGGGRGGRGGGSGRGRGRGRGGRGGKRRK